KEEDSKLDIRKLNFIGDPEKNVNLLYDKLEDKLAEKDFDLIKVNLPINKMEILTDLNKSASSVLVLRPRKTKLTDVIRAVELCNQFEINIIGIVSLESL
ncbi:MAG TPA: hypothetical protein VFD28_00180, partial [Candidatus Eisenbacteria bacterium]|nr:hypothetical protein [Candidatus Eisenbacteria bacterium]